MEISPGYIGDVFFFEDDYVVLPVKREKNIPIQKSLKTSPL